MNNLLSKMLSTDEALITVRVLGACLDEKLQEFARIIFVDDIINYSKKFDDYEQLKERPAFESLDVPRIVSQLNPTFPQFIGNEGSSIYSRP